MNAPQATEDRWRPDAVIASWLCPGMGHFLVGERVRGLVLLIAIGLVWFAGLMVAGVTAIDRTRNGAWFAPQALIAPTLAVDYVLQSRIKPAPSQDVSLADYPYRPGFARVHEQGVLFVALAGLLNLMAMLDVAYREPSRGRDPRRRARSEPNPDSDREAGLGPVGLAAAAGLAALAGAVLLMLSAMTLGYVPLMEPMPIDAYWLLLMPPLAIAIAVAYKAIRVEDLRRLPGQAAYLSGQIIVFMVAAAGVLWLMTELV